MSLAHNNRTTRRRRAKDRRGYAMLLVMVIILTSSAFVAVHQRNLNAALRIEQARIQSEDHRQGPVSVLAVACSRLETGDPPAPIDYRYDHTVDSVTTIYRVSYTSAGIQRTVTAVQDASAAGLPILPTTF
ncbi:MAG: hypothetical protein WBD20_07365 [Pirellulaceae bacterium]